MKYNFRLDDLMKFKCINCGQEYKRTHDNIFAVSKGAKLCQKCLFKDAQQRMINTKRSKAYREKSSKTMVAFYKTDKGQDALRRGVESFKKWLKTPEGKIHSAKQGEKLPHPSGTDHHNWNPNKTELQEYRCLVNYYTNKNDLSVLENYNKKRGLSGVVGAYQLDHVISIKDGYDNNIKPEVIGSIDNLQFITWEENRSKW